MIGQFSARHRGCIFSICAECLPWAEWQEPRPKLDTGSVIRPHDLWERAHPGRIAPEHWEHSQEREGLGGKDWLAFLEMWRALRGKEHMTCS